MYVERENLKSKDFTNSKMVSPGMPSRSFARRRRIQRRLSFSDAQPSASASAVSPVPDEDPPQLPMVPTPSSEGSEEEDGSSSQPSSSDSEEVAPEVNNSASSSAVSSDAHTSAPNGVSSVPNTESTWTAQSDSDPSRSGDSDDDNYDCDAGSEGNGLVQEVLGIVQERTESNTSGEFDRGIDDDSESDNSSTTSSSSEGDSDNTRSSFEEIDVSNAPADGDSDTVQPGAARGLANGSNEYSSSRSPHPSRGRDSNSSSSDEEGTTAQANGSYERTNGFSYGSDDSNDTHGNGNGDTDMSDPNGRAESDRTGSENNSGNDLNNANTDDEGNTNGAGSSTGSSLNNAHSSAAMNEMRDRPLRPSQLISASGDILLPENGHESRHGEHKETLSEKSEEAGTDDDDAPEEVQAADAAVNASERRAEERKIAQEVREATRTRRRHRVGDDGTNAQPQRSDDTNVQMDDVVQKDDTMLVDDDLPDYDLEEAAKRVERENRSREAHTQAEQLRIQRGRVHRPRSSRQVGGIDVAVLSHLSSASSLFPRTRAHRFSAAQFLSKESTRSRFGRVPSARAARSRR